MRTKPKRIRKRYEDPLKGSMGMVLFGKADDPVAPTGTVLLVSPRVGRVQRLPSGYELNTCSDCNSPVWVNSTFIARWAKEGRPVVVTCGDCSLGPDGDIEIMKPV